jgi:hypothetical protein
LRAESIFNARFFIPVSFSSPHLVPTSKNSLLTSQDAQELQSSPTPCPYPSSRVFSSDLPGNDGKNRIQGGCLRGPSTPFSNYESNCRLRSMRFLLGDTSGKGLLFFDSSSPGTFDIGWRRLGLPPQYSSGNNNVVALRSASVIIQIPSPSPCL